MINIFSFPKIQILTKKLGKFIAYFLYRKNIIILMGDKALFLCAFAHNKIVDSLFIASEDQENLQHCKGFLNKFKGYHVFFLLDGSECEVRHDLVPVLNLILKTNPVEKFIQEYFTANDIVAYSVYDIQTKASEFWNSLIVSAPYRPNLNNLLEYIFLSKKQKLGGIYFLSLEFITIINKIVNNFGNKEYNGHLQIFVCILNINGIKLIVKHKDNLIFIKIFNYPFDKSDLYIQGIIEQEISDCLIAQRSYIDNMNLEVCIIIIVDQNLKLLLEKSDFGQHHLICESTNMLLDVNEYSSNNRFSDQMIVKLFNEQKSFPASNKYLNAISRLNILSSLIIKPLIAIIILLIIVVSVIKIKTIVNYRKLSVLNAYYLNAEQDYYAIKQKYPYVQNATNLADLYVFETLLKIPVATPFESFERFLANLPPNMYLERIKWRRLNLDKIVSSNDQYIEIEILLKSITNGMSVEDSTKLIEQQIMNLGKIFNFINSEFTIFTDQILSLSDRVIIPVSVTITRKQR